MSDTRARLLDAAEAIVIDRGLSALTLDAVAAEAGVSKGGLLHHFRSKEALLRGVVGRMAEQMRMQFDAIHASVPEGPGQATRTVIAWATGCPPDQQARDLRIAAACLAAHAHDPALLDPIRAEHARIRALLAADGLAAGRAHLVLAAADGLFLAKVFSLWAPSATEASALSDAMREIAQ